MSETSMQRPLFAENSCRFTPLKTILSPFRHMTPSFISKRRKPIFSEMNSCIFPLTSLTSISSV